MFSTPQPVLLCLLQGLGKRPVCRSRNQHISQDHTTWATSLPLTIPQTASTYGSDFCRGRHMTQNDTLLTHNSELQHPSQRDSSPFLSRSSFHRFPRKHKSAVPCLDPLPPLSNLAGCCPQDPQQGAAAASSTPLSVLAESQRPFLPHNPWIYSYKS